MPSSSPFRSSCTLALIVHHVDRCWVSHLGLCDEGTMLMTCSRRPGMRVGHGRSPGCQGFSRKTGNQRRAYEGRTRTKIDEDPVPKAPLYKVARRKILAPGAWAESQREGRECRVGEEHVGQQWGHRRVLAVTHYYCNFTSISTKYSWNLAIEGYYGEIRHVGR